MKIVIHTNTHERKWTRALIALASCALFSQLAYSGAKKPPTPEKNLAESAPGRVKKVAAKQSEAEDRMQYGKTLFREKGCIMCHQLDGEGGKLGPDLTLEADRGRSEEWLTAQLKDPRSHKQDSIMPSFKDLTDQQLHALLALLQRREQKQGTNGHMSNVPPPQQ